MSEPLFDIVFYGIIQPGKDKAAVIENMALLFKTTPEKVQPFFVGGRKIIKSKVDKRTAERYRNSLDNLGLVIKLEAIETTPESGSETHTAPEAIDTTSINMAPAGADLLAHPPAGEAPPVVDTSDLSLAAVGADVLENPPEIEPQPIGDISTITLAEVGADVLVNPPATEPQPIPDISNITLAEVGADVIENPKRSETAPAPDTSDLSAETKGDG